MTKNYCSECGMEVVFHDTKGWIHFAIFKYQEKHLEEFPHVVELKDNFNNHEKLQVGRRQGGHLRTMLNL